MNKLLVAAIGIGAICAIPATTHADGLAEANCQTLTVTAPAGTRVLIGTDASPPFEVDDGNTRTVKFGYQAVDRHEWAVTVLGADGTVVDRADGVVEGCLPTPTTEPAPEVVEAPPAPAAPQPVVEVDVSLWAGVALAPPW